MSVDPVRDAKGGTFGVVGEGRNGNISLDSNWYDSSPPTRLEVFDLSDPAAPRLITRRWGRYRAEIHNGMLVTVQETSSGPKLCIEQGIR